MKYLVIFALLAIAGCFATFAVLGPQPPDGRPGQMPLSLGEMASCRECHLEATDAFLASRHHSTLFRGDDQSVLEAFVGDEVEGGNGFLPARFDVEDGNLNLHSADTVAKRQVEWVFGSGNRAWTPVTLLHDGIGYQGLLELDQSYYPEVGLGITLGHASNGFKSTDRGSHPIGIEHSTSESAECFNCHGRGAVIDETGTLRLDYFEPLLGCESCHPSARTHLLANGKTTAGIARRGDEPEFEIEMCGVCHRRAADVQLAARDHTKRGHLRFAPVGIELSKCFSGGASGLRCTSCHDAHHSDQTSELRRLSRVACAECHGEVPEESCSELSQRVRRGEMLTESSGDCLQCHMPAVGYLEGVSFTDHWIRIRDETDPPIAESD